MKSNEVAHSAFQRAALKPSIDLLLSPKLTEFQRDLRSHIHSLWQGDYTKLILIYPHYHQLMPTLSSPLPSHPLDRSFQFIYSRLHFGTTLYSLMPYTNEIIIPLNFAPAANRKPLFHLLLDTTCSSFSQLQHKYLHSRTMHKIPLALPEILSS